MEDNSKIRIGGIKFSEELVQVMAVREPADATSFDDLLHQLAGRQINIPFVCHANSIARSEINFCFLLSELGKVQEVLHFSTRANLSIRIVPSVGTLTLFPHGNSFRLLGLIIHFFGVNQYPIHSLSTSISAIALNTDFGLLDEIAQKLQGIVALPQNHAPFRQEFRLTQVL